MTQATVSENGVTRVPIHRNSIEEALQYKGRIPLREALHDAAFAACPWLQDLACEWDGRGEDLWSACHLEVAVEPPDLVVYLVAEGEGADEVLASLDR